MATIDAPSTGGIEIYGSNTTSGTASLLIEPDHDFKLRDDIYVGGGTVYMDATASPKRALQTSSTTLELNPDADFNLVRVESKLAVEDDMGITGNVNIAGQYRNIDNSFSVSNHTSSNGTTNMIAEKNGFCFLTYVYMNGEYANPDIMSCEVDISGGVWRLITVQGTPRGLNNNFDNTYCEARCVTWTR